MMRSNRIVRVIAGIFLVLLVMCPGAMCFANDGDSLQPIPALTGRVIDTAGMIAGSDKRQIEQTLSALEAKKGAQVVVLTVETTKPEEIEQYSLRVAEKWKLGRKGIDDGVILLVAKQDRRMRIEVGYGLEGAISDLIAKRIISDIITPSFKQRQFSVGISEGVDAIVKVINGEQLPAPKATELSSWQSLLFIIIAIIILVLMETFCPGLLTAIGIATMSSGSSRGGGDSFSGGGGGFGGGGASGSW